MIHSRFSQYNEQKRFSSIAVLVVKGCLQVRHLG
jgi:hypothetical protein